jgi:hypothetical protein
MDSNIDILSMIVAIISLIVAIIGCVIAVKSFKKSKRLEFFQRRDQLFAKISDLNAKNSEAHLISARYELVAFTMDSLGLSEEQAEKNTALIASIKELGKNIEKGAKNWDENIEQIHSIYSSLTPKTDAARVEKLIAMVQIASDDAKKYNDIMLSSLHILENINPITEEKKRRINLYFDEEVRRINLHFDEEVRRINLDLEKAIREFNEKVPLGPAS